MTLPITERERRQTPRTTIERLAYIDIEPDNGGSVLNVSEGGLCFDSIAPVQRNTTIRLWFSECNQRIEVDGALAWTDETQKTGGVRFTTLSVEAREQIRNLIRQPRLLDFDQVSAGSVPQLRALAPLSGNRPDMKAPRASAPIAVVPPQAKTSKPLSGFSRGLATGLLISALVATVFLLHSHRRQFGESLIQLGERLAAKPQEQTQMMSPTSQTKLPAPRAVYGVSVEVERRSPTRALIPAKRPDTVPPKSQTKAAKPQPTRLDPAGSVAVSSIPPAISLPPVSVASNSNLILGELGTTPELVSANHPSGRTVDSREENAGSASEMYFEIGKFKDEFWARKATDQLAQLGFHATVVEKGYLWINSYYTLVGPYRDDEGAAEAHKKLVSRGFKPRAFERGSRNFTVNGGCDTFSRLLRSGPTPSTHMPVGDCTISWESYSAHALVKFVQDNYVVATADGKWVKRSIRYERDAFVYRKNGDGSRTLIEIWFAGMSQALVFGTSS
jgi:PilZ domain